METCKPIEIIVHEVVKDDPATIYFLGQCPGVRVKYVTSGIPKEIIRVSDVLAQAKGGMLDKIASHVGAAEGERRRPRR